MRRLSALGLAGLLASACAASLAPSIVRYPQFHYPASEASSVVIYKDPPPVEYEVIGEVRARVAADTPKDRLEASLREEASKIGANGLVIVVQDRVTEHKVQRPALSSQQPVGTSGTPGGGVTILPTQAGRMEEVTIRVHEKEITGVVIRFKK